MGGTLFYIFFGLWIAVIFTSIFLLNKRGKFAIILPILVVAASAVLFLTIKKSFHRNIPIWVKEYSFFPEKGYVYIGNAGGKGGIVLLNPLSDKTHLKIDFYKNHFRVKNLSTRKRVDFDGQGMDVLLMHPGKSIKILNNSVDILKFYTPLPFSRRIKFSINNSVKTTNFILNAKEKIKVRDLTLIFSYSPPFFAFLNLYLIELLLLILYAILSIYLFLRGKISLYGFIINTIIFLSIIFILPLWIIFSIALLLLFERRKYGLLLISVLMLIVILPFLKNGTVKLKAYNNNKRVSFAKTYPYGTHRMVIGHTLYRIYITPSSINLYPLSVEGIKEMPEMITSGDKFLMEFQHLTLPFPRDLIPVNPHLEKNIVITGKRGRLVLSSATHPLIASGRNYLLIGFLFFALSVLLTYTNMEIEKIVLTSNLYFLLFLSMEFLMAAGVFNSAFYFNFKSYLKYGYTPAILTILLAMFLIFVGTSSLKSMLTAGLTLKERLSLFSYETKRRKGKNIFEIISSPISGKVLWIDLLFLTSLLLIALQFVLGSETGIKSSGFSFQLFEAGKIFLAVYLADWLFRAEENKFLFPFWLPYLLTFIPFVFLILTIGDFSPLVVFLPVLAVHFILLRGNLKGKLIAFITFLIIAASGVYLSIHMFFPRDVALRIMAWLYPDVFTNYSEQFIRAFWLFKEGGIFGNFPLAFEFAHFVPLVQFDFPLALFSANFGIMGVLLLFLTIMVPLIILLKNGKGLLYSTYEKRWNFYVLFFSTLLFISQAAIPFLILTGLLPIMGQPFPFISKANSNLLFFAIPYYLLMIFLIEGRKSGQKV